MGVKEVYSNRESRMLCHPEAISPVSYPTSSGFPPYSLVSLSPLELTPQLPCASNTLTVSIASIISIMEQREPIRYSFPWSLWSNRCVASSKPIHPACPIVIIAPFRLYDPFPFPPRYSASYSRFLDSVILIIIIASTRVNTNTYWSSCYHHYSMRL